MVSASHSIEVDFHFQAARRLEGLPEGHPCGRLHGGSFSVTVVLEGPLDAVGWVRDFGAVEAAIAPVRDALDHRDLNSEVEGLGNPTSEHLCRWIFDALKPALPEITEVTLAESPTTRCRYRGRP